MRFLPSLITSLIVLISTGLYSYSSAWHPAIQTAVSAEVADSTEPSMKDWALTDVRWSDIPAPSDNPITEAKVELGSQLFFDPRLSKSNTTSCATCHDPSKGYSDGLAFFEGDHGKKGPRTSPTVINLAWAERYFWDGRAASLEEQALGPVASKAEMRQDMDVLEQELIDAGYEPAFKKAFGPEATITEDNLAKAIATFERTLVSHNAPFDRYMAGDEEAMTPAQVRGMELFRGKAQCSQCHSGPNFSDQGFHNIGVDTTDLGRYKHLPLPSMKYAFKTPGLRDVEYRAPYLHNGSEKTLRDVVEFYNRGGNPETRHLPNLGIEPLNLTDQEIGDLVAFMKALSGEGAHNYPAPELPKAEQLPSASNE